MTTHASDWLLAAPASATNPKADTPLFQPLMRLMRREDLSQNDAAALFTALIDVSADPA